MTDDRVAPPADQNLKAEVFQNTHAWSADDPAVLDGLEKLCKAAVARELAPIFSGQSPNHQHLYPPLHRDNAKWPIDETLRASMDGFNRVAIVEFLFKAAQHSPAAKDYVKLVFLKPKDIYAGIFPMDPGTLRRRAREGVVPMSVQLDENNIWYVAHEWQAFMRGLIAARDRGITWAQQWWETAFGPGGKPDK